MRSLVAAYQAHLVGRGMSPGTVALACEEVERMADWLWEQGLRAWSEVTPADLESWIERRDGQATRRGSAPSWHHRATVRKVVRGFFGWQHASGQRLDHPAQGLPPLSGSPAPVCVLTGEAVAQALEQAGVETRLGLRQRAVLEVLYGTGLRAGEVRRLEVGDVDLTQQRVRVRDGKGRCDRYVPLTQTAAQWLERYLTQARPELVARAAMPSPALWLNQVGRPWAKQAMQTAIRRAGQAAGVELTAHDLRRAYATHLLQGGADVREIQRLLGHRHLDSTQSYTQVTTDDLRTMVRRLERNEPSL